MDSGILIVARFNSIIFIDRLFLKTIFIPGELFPSLQSCARECFLMSNPLGSRSSKPPLDEKVMFGF